LNICWKKLKQGHTFKVQGVKFKRRATLELTTGVGCIYSVSRQRQTTGVIVERNKHRKCLTMTPWNDIEDEAERLLVISKGSRMQQKKDTMMMNWRTTKKWNWDETVPYNKVISGRRRPDSVCRGRTTDRNT
jgi:hypothetical protein